MDFRLTEEQRAFQESVRRFAADRLAKDAVARAHDEAFPWDVARAMAENGLFGIMLPEEDGGQGGSLMEAVLAAEAVARRRASGGQFRRLPHLRRIRHA